VPAQPRSPTPLPLSVRDDLRADCERCFALCCVAPAFSASADFAIDKDAGQPCPNLRADFRCSIHERLRPEGFPGCTAYDCFGAGQKVAQVTFGGRDWRQAPETAPQMFAVLTIMRQLHELLWYLTEALTLLQRGATAALPDTAERADRAHAADGASDPLHAELRAALDETERLTERGPDALVALDVAAHRGDVNALLLRASELVRAEVVRSPKDHRGADLIGADLRGADLRGASLRGAYLVGADLRVADLRVADLIGADLRGADLRGADLTGSVFLTQSQLDAAEGDADTRLPPERTRPAHW